MGCPSLDGQCFHHHNLKGETFMSKKPGTKSYSAELREKAVRLVTERGYSLSQVAKQFGCSLETIRRWKEAAVRKADPELAARIELEENETKRLRKEVAQLKQDLEILKKAAAYFAKETL
jgi:transposase